MDKDRLAPATHSTAFGVTCGFTVAFSAATSFEAPRAGMLGGPRAWHRLKRAVRPVGHVAGSWMEWRLLIWI
jgi:hypothetical protein